MASSYSGTSAYETFGTTSPVTGAAPTVATDGQPLQDLTGITVVVAAADTRTLSGAGTLDCYVYDALTALWSRCPSGDFTLVGIPATQRSIAFETVDVICPRNSRIKWIPTGATFSAGSAGVTVYQLGHSRLARGTYP